MLPIIFEVPQGPLPREILADTWSWLRQTYRGECGRVIEEAPAQGGIYRVTLEVPLREGAYLLLLDALTSINIWARRLAAERRAPFPSVYDGALRYEEEPPGFEIWATTPALFARGVGDCEDIAADRAAELQLAGIPARAVIRMEARNTNGTYWHVLVKHPNGTLEDPCIPLGMTP